MDKEDLRGRLLTAILHTVRDDDSLSYLVGLELPAAEFAECRNREKAEAYLDGLLGQMKRVFMHAWDDWQALESDDGKPDQI